MLMKIAIDRSAAVLTLLLGAVHIVLTPVFYSSLSLPAMWFVGSGLALVLLGFHNLVLQRAGGDRTVWQLTLLANVGGVVFASLLAWVHPVPQVLLVWVLMIVLLVGSWQTGRVRAEQPAQPTR
jgi:hypothetical protein